MGRFTKIMDVLFYISTMGVLLGAHSWDSFLIFFVCFKIKAVCLMIKLIECH